MNNYTIIHCHSDLSNGTTTMDSVTKFNQYVDFAKNAGMNALAITEHGNIFEWYHKKQSIEMAGMKYIHAVEAYITINLNEKIRDNYHVCLYALNFDGFLELNKLISESFNRSGNNFYYSPRISYDALKRTSNNIAITTACLGGILNSNDMELENDFINFILKNKHRIFLEIQHHNVEDQKLYNNKLYNLNISYGIMLIAGTDTHSLNTDYADGRIILQKAKNIHFDNEDGWDLTCKTYDELVHAYEQQQSIPMDAYMEAIENTNKLADMVSEFDLDKSTKYVKMYDNPDQIFKQKINNAVRSHKYISRHDRKLLNDRVREEFDVYKKTGTIDFMLFQTYLREWEVKNNVHCGYGRGSISGSQIAYILGITDMDSMKFGLNFFRFMNPERVSNADIDTDYSKEDREKVREFLFNHEGLHVSEIITFNTIALKGAIRDVGRALEVDLSIINEICSNVETQEDIYRNNYQELFKYVDLLQGVIVSIGTHPAGILISPISIDDNVGLCSLATTNYPVSSLNMKELDDLMYTKLDLLGLDNVGVINDTCKLANIDRITPDNINLEDLDVWDSIKNDTTGIFQWESNSAQAYLKKIFSDSTVNKLKDKMKNFEYIKLLSFANGLIRPACESYRDDVANGNFYDNGLNELNDFLSNTAGRVTMQEDIMQFLSKFCGYSMAESDSIRRLIAKKQDKSLIEPELKEIKRRFIDYTAKVYNVPKEKSEIIIEPFLDVILSASDYAFSWNHSDSYSCIGYACGWLRYYYPYEFLTASLNTFKDKEEKTNNLIEYANKNNININPAKFRYSKSEYMFDKNTKSIYKGMSSIKHLNEQVSNELYELRDKKYDSFLSLLIDLVDTSVNSRQLDILIKLDFFSEFGKAKQLLSMVEYFNMIYGKKVLSKSKISDDIVEIISKYSRETKSQYRDLDNYAILMDIYATIPNEDIPITEKMEVQKEYLGYIDIRIDTNRYNCVVLNIDTKYKPKVTVMSLNSGKSVVAKCSKELVSSVDVGDLVHVPSMKQELGWTKDANGKWIRDANKKEWHIKRMFKIHEKELYDGS